MPVLGLQCLRADCFLFAIFLFAAHNLYNLLSTALFFHTNIILRQRCASCLRRFQSCFVCCDVVIDDIGRVTGCSISTQHPFDCQHFEHAEAHFDFSWQEIADPLPLCSLLLMNFCFDVPPRNL